MKDTKTTIMWVLTGFFAISSLVFMPSFASLAAIIVAVLLAPIPKWQALLSKYIKGATKTIIAIVLSIVTIFTAPTSDTNNNAIEPTTASVSATTLPQTNAPVEHVGETTTFVEVDVTETTPSNNTTQSITHIHSFSSATCTTPQICSVCGATEGTAIGHSWKSATCSTPKTCISCGMTEGETIPHNWIEATYTSPKTCTACGTTEGNPLDVPGKANYHGHVYTGGDSSTKYHYEADCAGKYSHEITWDEVVRRGLSPCGTCVLK